MGSVEQLQVIRLTGHKQATNVRDTAVQADDICKRSDIRMDILVDILWIYL
jgi:hypothetical protein